MLNRKWIVDNMGRLVAIWSGFEPREPVTRFSEQPSLTVVASELQHGSSPQGIGRAPGPTAALEACAPALIHKLILIPYRRRRNHGQAIARNGG